jgi:hypothetical protein
MKKKGFIHHPMLLLVWGFLAGLIVMYLIARGIIPLPIPIC